MYTRATSVPPAVGCDDERPAGFFDGELEDAQRMRLAAEAEAIDHELRRVVLGRLVSSGLPVRLFFRICSSSAAPAEPPR